jgi:phytoene dehydrogenase-like protein
MSSKSIIIIGAGIAGLSTGCYAQMNGFQSQIFEHHSKPGGLAAWWRRGKYLIDGGIHFLIAHKEGTPIYDVYREIATADRSTLVDMTTYMRFMDETRELSIDFISDIEKLEEDLLQISPEDKDEIHDFIKEVEWLKDSPLLTDLGMSVKPPELKGRFSSLKEMWQMRSFMKYFTGKYSKTSRVYAKRFQNPFLQSVFENLFSPDGQIWFAIMILATVAAGQLGLLKGGCPSFIKPIEAHYKSLGGKINYNSKVEKILVENNTAVGILLSDGTEYRGDVVISAADGKSTIYNLLDGNYVDEKIDKRYGNWKRYDPLVTVSFGVKRVFDDCPHFCVFMMKEPLKVGNTLTKLLPLRVFNYSDEFAPKGCTVIQVMLETEWEYWINLHSNSEVYEKEKNELARNIIKELDNHYPGIESQIDMIDVATPCTTWRYTLNDEGSPMGWMISKESLMSQIKRTLPGLENFYMAGQWVLPGGGVPGCIYTGRNVIEILCQHNGKTFEKITY